MTATRLGARKWLTIVLVGLVGQFAWTIENMYFNVYLYNTISTDPDYIAAMVGWSAAAATLTALLRLGEEIHLWTPEDPCLYELTLALGEDRVESYFAMRSFSVQADSEGVKRLCLNGKPYFHNGLLDQGWWPDGLYTAPSDEALSYDIEAAKAMGFNMLRKHVKVEPLRWYYHCDRLGMLVWQDMPNGGGS